MRSAPENAHAGARGDSIEPAQQPRNPAIDRYRGAMVFLMVAGDYLGGVGFVPTFLKHAPDIGLTVADLVAPGFIFAIGLNYRPSYLRRARTGMAGAYRLVIVRYLALIGIGAILTAGGTSVAGQPTSWGVLQAIGIAGLICIPVIRFGTTVRFIIGAGLLIGYQWLLDAVALHDVLGAVQGGFIGGISWGALLILSTAVADIWRRDTARYAICCSVLALIALASALLVPVSKNRVSLSYVLIGLAVGAIVFLLVDVGSRAVPDRAGFFSWWGENPLALYLLHLLLLGLVVVLPAAPWWYAEAPPWLAGAQLVALLGLVSLAAWWLHHRRVRIEL